MFLCAKEGGFWLPRWFCLNHILHQYISLLKPTFIILVNILQNIQVEGKSNAQVKEFDEEIFDDDDFYHQVNFNLEVPNVLLK